VETARVTPVNHVLHARETAAEMEDDARGDSTVAIQLPPTAVAWLVIEQSREGDRMSVRSADGAFFIGEITEVDEDRYIITVELS
jgi:hypothetical protein